MTATTRAQLRLSDLATRRPTDFDITPDAPARAALAQALDIIGVKKARLHGTLRPSGKRDWLLEAQLGATVVQACVVTLDPVTTRIDEPVRRSFVTDPEEITGNELEMPEDDSVEPLPEVLDLNHVLFEALTLALPAFPRADGAELGALVYTAPGAAPMTDQDAKPFAGLGALRDVLSKSDDSSGGDDG